MAELGALTHAFMRAHPAEAARLLEAQAAEQVAQLFERAPAHAGAPVLAAMLPGSAARALALLPDERVLELARALGTLPMVALLRHLPERRRGALLAAMPTAAALASTVLLGYPEHSVGAWCDPDIVALDAAARVADALERVRRSELQLGWVFVTDEAQRLRGWVALAQLLRAGDEVALQSLCARCPAVLAANAPLAAAAEHPGWREGSLLPVVEPGGRLVGVLARDALERALGEPVEASSAAGEGVGGVLGRGYWESFAGIAEALLPLLPSVPALGAKGDGR